MCCGGGGGPTYVWPKLDFASTFEISPNDGTGAFARAWAFPGAGSESLAGAADIDGDGDVDFVAGRCVFYGQGPWTEHPMPVFAGTDATIVGRPWLLRDIDRDGDPDFFVGVNDGSGTATASLPTIAAPAGYNFGAYIEADVDGDGAKDIVQRLISYNPPAPAQFQAMVMLQNNGGGHFRYAGPVGPPGMQIGSQYAYTVDNYLGVDLDGDGDDDIVANEQLNGLNGTCQLFWNDHGTFVPGPTYSIFTGGRVDAVADFDGDGLPDLLMSGNVTGLHVRRGTGDPVTPFVTTWSAPLMPFEPAAVAVGDVNDDGRLDFVRPNDTGQPVLFVNQTPPGGTPTFVAYPLAGVNVVLGSSSFSAPVRSTIAIADFDGDGLTDLALGQIPLEPNIGIVLRRVGWSSTPSLADFQVIRHAFNDGFAADADGDGDIDLIASRTVKSRHFGGPTAGRRVQLHQGTPGEDGAIPLLGASGPFRVGETEVLRLTGVPGPTIAAIGISLDTVELPNVPLPGMTLWLDPTSLVVGTWVINEAGHGRAAAQASLPIYLPNGLQGVSFWVQAFVFDPATPALFTSTNTLLKAVGG